MSYVSHGGQIQTPMGHLAKETRITRKAYKCGIKFTKENFKWLAEHYMNTCRSSYEAVNQIPLYEEIIQRVDLEVDREYDEVESAQEIAAPRRGRARRAERCSGTCFGMRIFGTKYWFHQPV